VTNWLENPVLVREMRQAARLARTPVILSVVTIVAGLLVCAIGGAASTTAPPAEVGAILYQAFFSLSFAIVAWVGPGVAALTIVSERAGRTWEPLVLTGLLPRVVAHGKLLAALAYIGLYLAALAPVGVLPFLFGGVTATEVLLGYVLLAIFSVIAVGFGLAVSSGAATPAIALLVTLPLAVATSMLTYFGFGVGLSYLAHELWSSVPDGMPVWLPTAYVRAELGAPYAAYLVALPLAVAAILAALFREVTIANLSDPNDDRSTGLKRWFVFAAAGVTVVGSLPPLLAPSEAPLLALVAEGVLALLSTFALFVLSSDPPGPSRRVLSTWNRQRAGALRRFMGPGMPQTALLLVGGTAIGEGALVAVSHFTARGLVATRFADGPAVFATYTTCFFAFLAGFATFARSLRPGRLPPRALLGLSLFGAVAGPLFVVAIAGMTTSMDESALYLAAPSPLYVLAMIRDLGGLSVRHGALVAGGVAMAAWATLGTALGTAGARRLSAQRREREDAWKALEARIAAEAPPAPSVPPPAAAELGSGAA
jgi:hypothetical protein